MRWILENIQVVIVIAGAIAYWLNQRQRIKQGLPPVDEDGNPIPQKHPPQAALEGTDDAARTRRIQEEIRRKIAERRGEPGAPSAPPPMTIPAPVRRVEAPPPVFQDPVQEMMKELQRRLVPVPAAPPPPPAIDQAALARQREIEDRFKALEAQQQAAQQRVADIKATDAATAASAELAYQASSAGWLAELHDPQTARRAIVLREILGTPVGLR
ncbi:MAG TPA: hypothetical protein VMC06_06855 [Opitutaceae bacterium]|nr:hypothetical protein [Opitutaceae bacterium]